MTPITNKPTTTPLVERNRHPAGRAFNMLFGVVPEFETTPVPWALDLGPIPPRWALHL